MPAIYGDCKPLVEKTCPICGRHFTTRRRTYCSHACSNRASFARRKHKPRACRRCGRTFIADYRQFCSDACRKASAAESRRKTKLPRCMACGAEFERPRRGPGSAYCSATCRYAAVTHALVERISVKEIWRRAAEIAARWTEEERARRAVQKPADWTPPVTGVFGIDRPYAEPEEE